MAKKKKVTTPKGAITTKKKAPKKKSVKKAKSKTSKKSPRRETAEKRTQKAKAQATKPQTTQTQTEDKPKARPRKTMRKKAASNWKLISLVILLPTLLYLAVTLSTNYALYVNRYENTKYTLDELYYAGWPIGEIKAEFESDYKFPKAINFTSEPLKEHDLSFYRTEIYYITDVEHAEVQDRMRQQRQSAAPFYIQEVAQPTANLERMSEFLDEGIDTENYDMMSEMVSEIHTEIESLTERQEEDIDTKIDKKQESIEYIVNMAYHYGLDLSESNDLAAEISVQDIDNLEKYLQLDALKLETAAKLDEAIVERGGWTTDDKRIFISLSTQRLYMIENYEVIYDMPASTGKHGHGTAVGEFQVYEKVPNAWGYYNIWMPYWITVYYSGGLENGIHGIPVSPTSGRWTHWENVVGVYPITYGCIMPHDWDAKIVYEWAEVGIPVSIVY